MGLLVFLAARLRIATMAGRRSGNEHDRMPAIQLMQNQSNGCNFARSLAQPRTSSMSSIEAYMLVAPAFAAAAATPAAVAAARCRVAPVVVAAAVAAAAGRAAAADVIRCPTAARWLVLRAAAVLPVFGAAATTQVCSTERRWAIS